MTRQHTPARAADLTAKDWGLILTALHAYQHHAAYRDLHGKVALQGDLVHVRGTIRETSYDKDGETRYGVTLAADQFDRLVAKDRT